MNPRFFFLGGLALLAFTTGAFAETPSGGPVTIVNLTNSSPETPTAPSTPSTPDTSDADKPAAAPEKKTPPAPASAAATAAASVPTAPAAKPAAKGTGSILDKYISDLADAVKLSDDEKKEVQAFYQADGTTLQKILNNDALSPLQQAEQVADLRDQRDAKIDTLLQDPLRQHEFYEVEANYRVALTEFAADGGLVPAPAAPAAPPPAAPAPAK